MAEIGTTAGPAQDALTCSQVSKSYAGTRVLDSFECRIAAGEVHALLGENGSGKSTFIKILAGIVTPDDGDASVRIGGVELDFGSPGSALAVGCRFVHQDLGLIDDMTVMENVLMVAGFPTRGGAIRLRASRAGVRADLERVGLDIDPRMMVGELSPATKTGVAVARALRPNGDAPARLLVLDEPTATMPDDEVERLMAVVRRTQASGVGILYVSHRLDEVFDIAATVTVLRDGHRITSQPVETLDKRTLVSMIAGEELVTEIQEASSREHHVGRSVFTVEQVSGASVASASFEVRRGEIVGIAGITGSGRETLLPLLFGALKRRSGKVSVGDRTVPGARPNVAVSRGLGYLPPDRKISGGFVDLTALENTTIGDLRPFRSPTGLKRKRERSESRDWLRRMHVRPVDALDVPLGSFSGGNQQKILFAKWLRLGLDVFLLDEPTQGVDVHAKSVLHQQLLASAKDGLAAVVSSTDADELVVLCDRVLVFRGGVIADELSGAGLTSRAINHACLYSGTEVTA